jgi:septal ring factor EnvC (AmiA/AmiB activator)
MNPTWVHTAIKDFKSDLQPQFEAKEVVKSTLDNWNKYDEKLRRNVKFYQGEIQKLQQQIAEHERTIAETNHMIATSDARRMSEVEKAKVAERAFQQQFAPFLQKYSKHL